MTSYVRRLRDMKTSAPLEGQSAKQLNNYADGCGWT
jgi:hypothetical protein